MQKVLLSLFIAAISTSAAQAQAPLIVLGLTENQRLITFSENAPEAATSLGTITGLKGADTALVGIDFRVQDGKLYGVGNGGGVYTINTSNTTANLVNRLSIPLTGKDFGVDFNPAADRLRIISNTGQNLRHDVNPGGVTVLDGALNYTTGITADKLSAAAYTNNDLDPNTATTLYDIDHKLDQVVIQAPANNGSLSPTGKLTVRSFAPVGFDIFSKLQNGVTVSVEGLASITKADGLARLYSINLPTGKATERGTFKANHKVLDIAIPLDEI